MLNEDELFLIADVFGENSPLTAPMRLSRQVENIKAWVNVELEKVKANKPTSNNMAEENEVQEGQVSEAPAEGEAAPAPEAAPEAPAEESAA